MTLEKNYALDGIDLQILNAFETEGRISVKKLADRITMSAPSVKERISRLEARGIISNFSVNINLKRLGYSISAIVRIKPRAGQLDLVESMILAQHRFTSCDRVTGDDCYIAKLMLKSIDELDDLLKPFHSCAETNTSIIKSSLINHREPFTSSPPTKVS